jgi:hypothetical protein
VNVGAHARIAQFSGDLRNFVAFLLSIEAIAGTYWHIHRQPRSA